MRRTVMVAVVLLGILCMAKADAQEMRGLVRDSSTRSPIVGAVLTLLDGSGAVLGRLVTDERGEFRVSRAAGVRQLRAQRLGFRVRELEAPAARDGVITLDVAMVSLPSLLEPIQVVAPAQCPHRDDTDRAFALLQQARAGLLTLVVNRDSNPGTVVRVKYKRHMEGTSDVILDQEVRIDTSKGALISFSAARSSADFVRLGFVKETRGTQAFFGPDADVLLDDAFNEGYCFRIHEPDRARPTQIGLGFTPGIPKTGRVDIDGVLWIDTIARALRDIEYRYVGLGPADNMHPGGRTSFRELPNGVVLIDPWIIRSPNTEEARSAEDLLHGRYAVIETGGEVLSAKWPDGTTWQGSSAKIRLHATTINGSPATNAMLSLMNTDFRALTDAKGDVEIGDLVPGPYAVTVVDPSFDAIGLSMPPLLTVVAALGTPVSGTVVAKTARDYVIARCLAEHGTRGLPAEMDSALLVLGRVVRSDGTPANGVQVLFKLPSGKPVPPTTGDDAGIFALCLDKSHRQAPMQILAKSADGASVLTSRTLATALTTVTVKFTGVPAVADLNPEVPPVTLRGIAYDSLHGAPLTGAFISMLPGGRTTTSTDSGAFVFDSVAAGTYLFAMQHDVLDAIGMSAVSTRFTVGDGRDTVRVSVPSFARLWAVACHTPSPSADFGIIFGTVHDISGRNGQAGASVRGAWISLAQDNKTITEQQWHIDVESDSTGGYALCGVPLSTSVELRATTDSSATGRINLEPLDKERITRRDLTLGRPASSDTMARGFVVGSVSDDHGPLRDARVLADGVSEVRTGVDGRFILRGVAAGTQQIDVRAIGLTPATAVVDVVARDTARVDIRLGRVTLLDSVRVNGRVNSRQLLVTQFMERRRQGLGKFKDSTEIAKSNTLLNVFADMPVTVRTQRGGMLDFQMLGCTPALVIDRVTSNRWILESLLPQDIAAIEFYTKGTTPVEFGGMDKCAIVIWTKRGWP